jgi:glyceraldehyde 3-phosphate dehydrogenase
MQESKLAINGMGRIGRTLFRLLHANGLLPRLVAVNDIMPKDNLIYLLKYDSIRGIFQGDITSTASGFSVNGHEIHYYQEPDISKLPWHNHSVKTVVEATGLFTHSADAALHLSSGASRVLLTTFSKDISSTIWGVNHHVVNRETKIISPGDCTLNCVTPLLTIVQENFGISSVYINVIQGYTTRQELLDGPYKGFRRGRAAAHSIIPFEVNITPVLENIFPLLKSKIESMSTRVPITCGGLAELSIVLEKTTNATSVNSILEKTSNGNLKNIIAFTSDPIVSSDILGDTRSGTIDSSLTKVLNNTHLKLFAWFDNEWGYANRLLDWLHVL